MKVLDVTKAYGFKNKTVALYEKEFDQYLSFRMRDSNGDFTGEIRYMYMPLSFKYKFTLRSDDRYIIPSSYSHSSLNDVNSWLIIAKNLGDHKISSSFDESKGKYVNDKNWYKVPETVANTYNMQPVEYLLEDRDINLLYLMIESDIKLNGFTSHTVSKAKEAIQEIKKLALQD